MLTLPLKATEKVELQRTLFKFVEVAYSEESAEEHREAFLRVASLRESCRQLNAAPDEKGEADNNVRLLARYHRLLTTMRRQRVKADVRVTNQSDKDKQLPKIKALNADTRAAFQSMTALVHSKATNSAACSSCAPTGEVGSV